MPADGPPDGYVTSAEACARLGISDRTLRRRVQAGAIDGEYVARPQGSVLYVKLPADLAAHDAAPDGEPQKVGEIAEESRGNDAAVVTALLDRLDSKDAALLAATERAARAEAERDAAQETAAAAERRAADLAAELARLRERRWWKWW